MKLPLVSVIIPVFNETTTIKKVLECLLNQSYPADRYQIIIIDNGSSDDTVEKVREYPVKLLFENSVKNPYMARNKGLENVDGSVIALTDGNKIPAEDWIEKGIECIKNGNDLIGGKVEFTFSEKKSLGEIYDSITFLDNEKYVEIEKGSVGGNLFFKKKVLQQIGKFPSGYRSGIDIYWSRKAVNVGFKLGYCPDAIVFSQARKLGNVLKKSYRIGTGHPLTFYNSGKTFSDIFYHTIASFSPPSAKILSQRIDRRGKQEYFNFFYRFWAIDYLRRVSMGIGRMVGIFKLIKEIYHEDY